MSASKYRRFFLAKSKVDRLRIVSRSHFRNCRYFGTHLQENEEIVFIISPLTHQKRNRGAKLRKSFRSHLKMKKENARAKPSAFSFFCYLTKLNHIHTSEAQTAVE